MIHIEPVDFDVVNEDWTVVELEDGTILKIRPVLLFVYRKSDPDSAEGIGIRWNLQIAVWSDEKGAPSEGPITPDRIKESIEDENLSFRFLSRGESVYIVRAGPRLSLRQAPARFDRTSLFDSDGEPVYKVDSEMQLSMEDGTDSDTTPSTGDR